MLLEGKRGLIMGVANRRSLAWGIAQACQQEGAEVALSYASERLEKEAAKLAEQLGEGTRILPCDITKDEEVAACFQTLEKDWGNLDFVVHAIAYADKAELARPFVETSREGFHQAQDISAYSMVAVARHAAPLLEASGGGALLTLTYLGGQRVCPGYNLMGVAKATLEHSVRYLANDLGPQGIRVNGLSAGPIKTLAARGIRNFNGMQAHHRENAPLRQDTTVEQVADAATFLLSSRSAGVTGQILFVDGGFSIL